jgi:signal transduction histidine kinase
VVINAWTQETDASVSRSFKRQHLLRALGWALACAGSAAAGLWWAALPGAAFGSVAPAAGFAMAALLLAGRGLWPAVALGLGAGHLAAAWAGVPVGGALSLLAEVAAQTLQAWVGAWILGRQVRLPTRLRSGGKLMKLIGLGSLAGLLHASLALAWQPKWPLVEGHAGMAWTWASQATGDVLGIVWWMPLLLFAAVPGIWRERRGWMVSGVALCGLLGATLLVQRVIDWESVRLQGQFRHQALLGSRTLHESLTQTERELRLMQALTDTTATGGVSQEAVEALRHHNPAWRSVALLRWQAGARRAQWRWQLPPPADKRPPGDWMAVPGAWEPMLQQAMVSGEALALPRSEALPTGPSTVLLALSLAPRGRPQGEGLRDLALVWVDAAALMAQAMATSTYEDAFVLAGLSQRLQGVDYRVLAVSGVGRETELVASNPARREDVGPVAVPGWLRVRAPEPERFDHQLAGQVWRLEVAAQPAFGTLNASGRPGLALLLGLLVSALFNALALVATGQRALLQALVDKKTVELDQSLMLLEDTVDGYQQQSEQLKLVLRSTPAGFLAFDAQGRVAFVNDAMVQLLRRPEEDLRGLMRSDFAAQLAQQCVGGPEELKQLLTTDGDPGGATAPLRVPLQADGDEERVLEFSRSSVSGALVQSVYLAVDVTESVRLEQSKTQFIANAAHEIRTPLTSILGYSHLLQRKPEMMLMMRSQMLQHVIDKANDLNSLLRNMLDLAELETQGRDSMRWAEVSLRDMVLGAVDKFGRPEGRDPPQLILQEAAMHCQGSHSKLVLLLRHLLANAYAFSDAPSTVQVALDAVPAGPGRELARLQVCDQGSGMSAEQSDQAFDRFYRADTSGSKPGFGLGLCIVKLVAEMHHGSVQIDSAPGKGTRVTVLLPMDEVQPA